MELNEKLRQLRTGKSLTQEQLAEQLYVSGTTTPKQEGGKGYPNIESLRRISKFFPVTIDELLSGEELVTLAETESHSNLKKIYNHIYGILDMTAITFIFLPLYGNSVGDYVYAVNLLPSAVTTPFNLVVYWSAFATSIAIGIAKVILIHLDKETRDDIATKRSPGLTASVICLLAAAGEPYITTLMFLPLVIKIVVWIKQSGTK